MVYTCLQEACKKSYADRKNMLRHFRTHSAPVALPKDFKCNECVKSFTTKSWLKDHQMNEHADSFRCEECSYCFPNVEFLETHKRTKHAKKLCKTCCCTKELDNSHNCQNCLCLGTECISCHRVLPPHCFEGEQRCKACTKKLNGEKCDIREVIDDLHITINSYNDWETILTERKQEIQQFLYKNVLIHKVIKYNITISVEFMKETSNQTKYQIAYFNSPPYIYNVTNVLDTSFLNQYFSKKIDDFNQNGSGWIYNKLAHIQVNVIKYKPIKGSTYFPLPSFISNKKSCINVKNNDDKCFLWSVIAAFHPAPYSRDRISHYKQY